MMPSDEFERPLPVVIVPFYDVDIPAGRNLSGRTFTSSGVDSFAYMAVQKGYIAVAIRWFGESYGEGYSEAVANLKLRNPHCSGLGKWVWDAHRLLDYLSEQPQVDARRIGIIGHSLGAKMAIYAAAFEPRITAVVANEGGTGLTFSNYEDYWYFGDSIQKVDKSTDQHELLALIAPRPFLLIGGDHYDTVESWHYINAARQVYELYGKPLNIGYFNHHRGHMPTPESVWRSMEWLAHFLGAVRLS
jgi:pimeloyl-ACP methyl ester carboxylesterase